MEPKELTVIYDNFNHKILYVFTEEFIAIRKLHRLLNGTDKCNLTDTKYASLLDRLEVMSMQEADDMMINEFQRAMDDLKA